MLIRIVLWFIQYSRHYGITANSGVGFGRYLLDRSRRPMSGIAWLRQHAGTDGTAKARPVKLIWNADYRMRICESDRKVKASYERPTVEHARLSGSGRSGSSSPNSLHY